MKTILHLLPLTGLLLSAGCWDPGPYGHHRHCPGGWDPLTRTCHHHRDMGGPDLGSPPDLGSSMPDLTGVPLASYLWAKPYGAAGHDTAYGVAADAAGNAIVVGTFQGTVDFGGGPVTSAGSSDIFIAKLGGDGTLLWAQSIGGAGDDEAYSVAVDPTGDIVVAGTFQDTISLGASSLTSLGGYDALVVKLSPAGAVLWAHGYGGALDDAASSVAVDSLGNAHVTGYFTGTANFGGTGLTSAGGADVFLAKYGASGAHLWSQRFGGSSDDVGNRVAVDGTGKVALAGQFSGTASFGGVDLISPGTSQGFVGRYTSSGAYSWSRGLGGTSIQVANGVAIDSAGNIAVLGAFQGAANFGGGAVTAAGPEDSFLARYSAAGTYLWAQHFGGMAAVTAGNLTGAADGSLVITGSANSDFSVGSTALTGGGVYAARFSSDGGLRWARNFPGTDNGDGLGVAVDPGSAVLLVGDFAGTVDFGGGPLSAAGDYDAFVLKLTP